MIDRETLQGFGTQDGVAVVTFDDGRALHFVPEWRGDSVKRVREVKLLQSDRVIAQVQEGVFESLSTVSQTDLAAYCAFATKLEREVYRYYRQGKISEDEWHARFREYWKIVIKSRQIMTALESEQLPVRSGSEF